MSDFGDLDVLRLKNELTFNIFYDIIKIPKTKGNDNYEKRK